LVERRRGMVRRNFNLAGFPDGLAVRNAGQVDGNLCGEV
jgi:hypothetical protein